MNVPTIVLFTGDPYRCERALSERSAALVAADPTCERHPHFADEVDVASLDTEIQSAPLFSLGRHFVVRHVEAARKPKPWADLLGRPLPPSTFVSLLGRDPKASNPIVKVCQTHGEVVALPSPAARSAAQATRTLLSERGLRPSPTAIEALVDRTGGDLLAAAQEAAKLASYGPQEGGVDAAMMARLVFPAAEAAAYPFYDRLGERDLRASLRALGDVREDAGRLLGGAVRHLTRLATLRLLVEQRVPPSEIESRTEIPAWLSRRLLTQAKHFQLKEVAAALALGVQLDTEVKSGGIQAIDALLQLVLSVTRPLAPASRG